MTVRLRDATLDDAMEVLANLSAITRTDVVSHHLTDDEVRERVELYFATGAAHVLDDDAPVRWRGVQAG